MYELLLYVESYQYADAMTVLINMALCKDFKFDEELALGLSGFLLEKEREMEVMELYSNLLSKNRGLL
jgi:hypothetical protein